MSLLLYFANMLCSAGQSAASKLYSTRGGEASAFNMNKTLWAFLLFFVWSLLRGQAVHLKTLPLAILYGVFLTVSMHCGFQALSMGPMALTSILASMSLIIPFLWGILFWQETLTVLSVFGVLLLLLSIMLINRGSRGKLSLKWLVYSMVTMLANGFCSVVQKYHQRLFPGQFQVDFMLLSMGTAALLLLISLFLSRKSFPKPSLLGAISGAMNGLANLMVLLLAATESAAFLFPLIAAGNAVGAWLTGLLLFREKTRRSQLIGLAAGILGVIVLNL